MKKSIFMKRKSSGSISPRGVQKDKRTNAKSEEIQPDKSTANNNTLGFMSTKAVTNEIIRNEIKKRKSEEQNLKQEKTTVGFVRRKYVFHKKCTDLKLNEHIFLLL